MSLPDSTWDPLWRASKSGPGEHFFSICRALFLQLSGDFFPRSAALILGPQTGPSFKGPCRRGPNSGPISKDSGGNPPQQHFAARLAHPHHLERGRLATWQWWHFRWRAQMSCLVPCVSCLMEPVSGLVRRTSWLLSRTRTRGRRQEAQAIRPERCDTGRFRDMETGVLEETTHTRHARQKTRDLGLEVEDARLQPHHILTCLRIV